MIHKAGEELIKHFESLHDGDLKKIGLQPKLDPLNIYTAGWGHALLSSDGKRFLKKGDERFLANHPLANMTTEEADALLSKDLALFVPKVQKLVKVDLTEMQLAALVSFTYNLGEGNLRSSTLLKKLNAKDFTGASEEFKKWNKGGGVPLKGLTRRRKAEKYLFLGTPIEDLDNIDDYK